MNYDGIIKWLLQGDVSIQYQVHRDILKEDNPNFQNKIENQGWGKQFLSYRKQDGHWGMRFYQPKWISTHYTLLDLKNLGISPECKPAKESAAMVVKTEKDPKGGILPIGKERKCDVCVNGMALNYLSYFKANPKDLESIVDFILSEKMADGGFNCFSNSVGARHSSLHTTLSVLEGFLEYRKNGYNYRIDEIEEAERSSREFILHHRLFKSDKTGKIIKQEFLKLAYPGRWKYDILRALDYFQFACHPYDDRMRDAIDILLKKRTKDGLWKLQAHHPGQLHFQMETPGHASRWNTLRALRVLRDFI